MAGRFPSVSLRVPNTATRDAPSPALFGDLGVAGRKLMSMIAVCESLFLGTAGSTTKGQPIPVNSFIFADKFCKRCDNSSPVDYRVSLEPVFLGNFMGRILNTFNGYLADIVSVLHVVRSGNPSTVVRAVIAIIINSIYLVAMRPLSHIVLKCREALLPFFAYRYSPAAVSVVSRGIRVVASVLHGQPNIINRVAFSPSHIYSPLMDDSIWLTEMEVD